MAAELESLGGPLTSRWVPRPCTARCAPRRSAPRRFARPAASRTPLVASQDHRLLLPDDADAPGVSVQDPHAPPTIRSPRPSRVPLRGRLLHRRAPRRPRARRRRWISREFRRRRPRLRPIRHGKNTHAVRRRRRRARARPSRRRLEDHPRCLGARRRRRARRSTRRRRRSQPGADVDAPTRGAPSATDRARRVGDAPERRRRRSLRPHRRGTGVRGDRERKLGRIRGPFRREFERDVSPPFRATSVEIASAEEAEAALAVARRASANWTFPRAPMARGRGRWRGRAPIARTPSRV